MSMQELLEDMQEQVGRLTALLQDERRSHEQSYRALFDEAEHKAEKCKQHHQLEMDQLMQDHRSEMSKLVAAHTRTLEDERKSAEERYALLKKDYDFLKCSFRPYKDSVLDDNCSKRKEEQERCLKKQLLWLKEQLNQSEAEREMERKAFQSETAELHASFKVELEDMKTQLKEKDMTISLLRAALHQIQEELNIMMCRLSELGKGV
ncbi:inner centromere protein [Pangasianodon hypophthalmus]|uniref:inner centromere protein n=1 Tax=Pangasianodon hypophthalmus TaxID=310915 RepID=UPI0023077E1E|nr:inner centromere protein [Pangasianodon hypophthalmus]